MTIFALDASGITGAVCVLRDGEVLYEKTIDEGLTHSQTLLPLVQEAFHAVGLTPDGVDLYAVTAGPGSFTGLRIGLAAVKGLALPFGTPVAAVSTLEAHARGCGQDGTLLCALNARRGEVYWAAFEKRGGQVTRLVEDAAQPAGELVALTGAWPKPIRLIGDGAGICYNTFKGRVDVVPGKDGNIAFGAALAAREMWQRGQACPAGQLAPRYLRLSQAERERAQKLETQ